MNKMAILLLVTLLTTGTTIMNAYSENLDRDYIEAEIWEEIWHGKGDDETVYPEASYKHHLLEEWLDENYGSDSYDWSEIGELKYAYKDYYRDYIENFDFEDNSNGNWTITTPEDSYSFTLFQVVIILVKFVARYLLNGGLLRYGEHCPQIKLCCVHFLNFLSMCFRFTVN